jgi:hypothetical protein
MSFKTKKHRTNLMRDVYDIRGENELFKYEYINTYINDMILYIINYCNQEEYKVEMVIALKRETNRFIEEKCDYEQLCDNDIINFKTKFLKGIENI